MRILLLNQFFWPDLAATSQLLTDLARHLADQGHDVTVICARSSYAGPDSTGAPLVRIIRIPDLPFGRGAVARLLSSFSFLCAAFWLGLRIPKPNLAITLTTPPLLAVICGLLKTFRGVRYRIWEMDMYPDVAVDVGILAKDAWLTRALGAMADYARRNAEGVVALGECMRQRLLARGVPASNITIAENWADGARLSVGKRSPHDTLTVVYPGNLGLGHDVATLAAAIRELDSRQAAVRFLFIGGGVRMRTLEEECRAGGIHNASFLRYCNPDELAGLVSAAHIGLVTINPTCVGSIVPSKIYALMAAGLGVLFIGPPSATPGRIIDRYQCGWQVDCGDHQQLVSLLSSLAASPGMVHAAGLRSQEAFSAYHDRPVAVAKLCQALSIEPRYATTAGAQVHATS